METNPKQAARKKAKAAKKFNRNVKKHAKWAGLNMNNPKEAKEARETYKSLTAKVIMKHGGKVKSNYNGFDMQPS